MTKEQFRIRHMSQSGILRRVGRFDEGFSMSFWMVGFLNLQPLQGQSLSPWSLQNTVLASTEVIHAMVKVLEGEVKLQ